MSQLLGQVGSEALPRVPSPYQGEAPEPKMPQISVGFTNLQSFEFTQRVARALCSSNIVPVSYRSMIPRRGRRNEMEENPNAIPNCIVALNMAARLNTDVLTIMQNLDVIDGRPSWRSQFFIALINNSGVIDRLKYRFDDRGKKTVKYTYSDWVEGQGKVKRTVDVPIHDWACVAWGKEPVTGEIIEGPEVSVEMAVLEGWYTRDGSKWATPMFRVMLAYRAASFWGRTNAPELTMGLHTVEEMADIIDARSEGDGTWTTEEPAATETDAQQAEEGAETQQADGETEVAYFALDANGDLVTNAAGQPVPWSANWFIDTWLDSDRREALMEANAAAIEAAIKDDEEVARLLEEVTKPQPPNEKVEEKIVHPMVVPIPMLKGGKPDRNAYLAAVQALLASLKTEAEVNTWLFANRPIFHGQIVAVRAEEMALARRAEIVRAPAPQQDKDAQRARGLIEQYAEVKLKHELDAVQRAETTKATIERLKDRPDLCRDIELAAQEAAVRVSQTPDRSQEPVQ